MDWVLAPRGTSLANDLTISVVIPSLNQCDLIGQAISSVLEQDYSSVELVVIDGGSTDSTLEVLRKFGDGLRWISEPDNGQADAINKGWQLMSGDIVAYLNSDDAYLPGAFAQAAYFFEQRPMVDVVYGDCDYVDRDGQRISAFPTRQFDYDLLLRSTQNYVPQPAAFIRRRAIEDVGFLDMKLAYVMDYDLWLRLGIRHRFEYLPAKLAVLRLHAETKTSRESACFPAEVLLMYERFFAQADLPPVIRAAEPEAIGNAYYLLAQRAFLAHRWREATSWLLRSWRRSPAKLRVPAPLALIGSLELPGARRWSPRRRPIP